MIKYDGRIHDFEIGSTFDYRIMRKRPVYYKMGRHNSLLIEAQPRYGKSVLTKDLVVQVSKIRKVVIFDYDDEWVKNIMGYNLESPYPDRLVGAKVIKNFTFNIMEFSNIADFASLGFKGAQVHIVCNVIQESYNKHKGNIHKITEILANLPTSKDGHLQFNEWYNTKLLDRIHASTKTTILTHWKEIMKYFWQGEHDTRPIYDFSKLILKYDHLIINFPDNIFLLRTYAAKILEQLQEVWAKAKFVLVVEEARMYFPYSDNESEALSINNEMYDFVTHGPKHGVLCFLIMQNRSQIFQDLLPNIPEKIVGRVSQSYGAPEHRVSKKYFPHNNIREFVYVDVTASDEDFHYTKFRPRVPCMSFVSDR